MGPEDTVLLSTAYFGPIQYFTKFLISTKRIIERYDHYSKQTYRNRCKIYGGNGVLILSIPVQKGSEHKSHVRDVRIDYVKNWQKRHWKGIESAYMHSPFFEFYMDDFQSFLGKKYEFLIDLNLELLDFLLKALDIEIEYSLTDDFIETGPQQIIDCREIIHPKRDFASDPHFRAQTYPQVFADRMGFKENLSIIDLLFNEGPNARSVLEKSIRGS